MEIIYNNSGVKANQDLSLNTIRGGKRISDVLLTVEKELLTQMAETLTIIYGGHFKKRRQIA